MGALANRLKELLYRLGTVITESVGETKIFRLPPGIQDRMFPEGIHHERDFIRERRQILLFQRWSVADYETALAGMTTAKFLVQLQKVLVILLYVCFRS